VIVDRSGGGHPVAAVSDPVHGEPGAWDECEGENNGPCLGAGVSVDSGWGVCWWGTTPRLPWPHLLTNKLRPRPLEHRRVTFSASEWTIIFED